MSGNPFGGSYLPSRVPLLFQRGRTTVPMPHPWNYTRPIEILDAYFAGADELSGAGRHNRYLRIPCIKLFLATRDPAVIRSVLASTGEQEDKFDRDTLPSVGIARATGADTLLFGNGSGWRRQRRAAVTPFGKNALFQEEIFSGFEETFRQATRRRLLTLRQHLLDTGRPSIQLAMEPEIKALMLEMLVACFFGARIDSDEIREVYVPAIERIIVHIVRDTVLNPLGLSRECLARFSRRYAQACRDVERFEELTSRVLASRRTGQGLWSAFRSEVPDAAIRSNIRVFLAGALEATTSYASWAIAHLARRPDYQEQVFAELQPIADFSPTTLATARHLHHALEETLRLTPALYFLPRRATQDTRVELGEAGDLIIPKGTHVLLDVWHANRHEDHWGREVTGYPALDFAPERWAELEARGVPPRQRLHFGFGHGQRICPGKNLGQLEVALLVGVMIKLFRFSAPQSELDATAGVSTKPTDGALVELSLREPSAGMTDAATWQSMLSGAS